MLKRKHGTDTPIKHKKKRKSITLQTKYDIITNQEAGGTVKNIAKKFDLNQSTVSTILKDKEKYLEEVKNSGCMQSTWLRTKQVNSLIPEMEKVLSAWICETRRVETRITGSVVCAKALSIFNALKAARTDCTETFVASSGWFDRYRKRAGLYTAKGSEEAAHADSAAAKLFPQTLREIIDEEGYTSAQIFNVAETGLCWKRMPARGPGKAHATPRFRAAKDRVMLLLGGNAAGDCKLKPMLVHCAENPRALRGIVRASLPVIWTANKKSRVTASQFTEWFTCHFVPAVKKYCDDTDIPFHVLLLVDNAPSHPPGIQHHHPNVKVLFMPVNKTHLVQPMDEGVISTFKAHYVRITFDALIEASNIHWEGDPTLDEFCKAFNILDAIQIVKQSWDKITQRNMQHAWHKLCPQFVDNLDECQDAANIVKTETDAIVNIAQQLRLDVSRTDVDYLLRSHEEPASDDQLDGATEREDDDDDDDDDNDSTVGTAIRSFTLEGLTEAFRHVEKAMAIFTAQDSNFERCQNVIAAVKSSCACYREIYKEIALM